MSEPTARVGELHPAKRQSINAELEAWRANKMEPNFAIQCMFAEALWERWNAAIPTEAAQPSEEHGRPFKPEPQSSLVTALQSELAEKDARIAELESIREKYLMLCAVHSTPSDFCIQTACRVGDDALTFLMEWEERIKKPFLEKIARLTAELRNASAETACCIKFLETELFWEDFRAEGFIGKDAVSASTRNCQKLAAFLKERGNHGAQLLAELAEANRKLELMPALVDGCRLTAIDRAREESAQGAEAQKGTE
jgi:hypothetical protein